MAALAGSSSRSVELLDPHDWGYQLTNLTTVDYEQVHGQQAVWRWSGLNDYHVVPLSANPRSVWWLGCMHVCSGLLWLGSMHACSGVLWLGCICMHRSVVARVHACMLRSVVAWVHA